VAQTSTVGLVGGFGDDGAIGTPEEPQRGDLQGAPSGCHQQCIVAEGKT